MLGEVIQGEVEGYDSRELRNLLGNEEYAHLFLAVNGRVVCSKED